MAEPRARPRVGGVGIGGIVGIALALLVALAGCSSDDGGEKKEPVAEQTTAPPPPAGPAAGKCYALPFDAAVAPTSEKDPIDCAQPHTSETVAVGTVNAIVDGHLLAIDSAHVQAQVATACPEQLNKYLGGSIKNLRLSMIRPVWFTPTVKESDAGAAWYRCDAVLLGGSEKLTETTGSIRGALKGEDIAKRYAMCGTAAPDAKDFQRVPCSARHSWRAIDVVVFAQESYPGEKKVRAAGRTQCEDAGADFAEDPLVFEWGYEWPTAEQWEHGQKYGRCWAPVS